MADWHDDEMRKLRAAEDAAATEMPGENGKTTEDVRGAESRAGGFYSGSGKEKSKKEGKGKFRGFFKKRGPMVAITGILTAVGGLTMGMQSLMPIAIQEMIIEKFNSIGVSSTMTSDTWLDTQLSYGVRMENLTTGTQENLFAFSEYQVKQFQARGIQVVEVGSAGTALVYEKNGQWIPVVSSSSVGNAGISSAVAQALGERGVENAGNVGAPISAKDALADRDFKTSYTMATKSWRGGGSGWFDDMMTNITEAKLSVNRNRWARYVAKSFKEMTADFKETAKSANRTKTTDYEISETKDYSIEEYERLGSPQPDDSWDPTNTDSVWHQNGKGESVTVTSVVPRYEEIDGEMVLVGYTVSGTNSDTTVKPDMDVGKLESTLNSKAVKAAAGAANLTCAAVEAMMSIYTVVSAYQSLQFLNLISGFLEAVDKVKAGDGDESPVHEYSTSLTTKMETVDNDGNGIGVVKTAIESEGMNNLFTDAKINSNDTSVMNVNFEAVMNNLSWMTGNTELTAKTFEACGYIKLATGAIDLATTIISFIPVGGQVLKFSQILVNVGKQLVLNAAIQTFFMVAIPKITQKVVNSIIKDAATEWFGEDLGNAMISGAGKYLGGNGTSGGQGPGSEDKVLAYLGAQQSVIAEEAEYQRSIRSPFDASSPYTFLGTLAYSLLPMAYSSSGIMSMLTDVSSLVSSSLVSILPTASAVDINEEMTSTGECPLLESTGAVGDAFCNPIIITDTDTINDNPVEVEEKTHAISGNFNDDGTINEESDLAKYVTYCGQRTAQYGVKDASTVDSLVSGVASTIMNITPVVDDAYGMVEQIYQNGRMEWMTGEACVVDDTNPYWHGNKGNNQLYQRYAENQRLLENTDPDYKSTVTAYLEKHYEKNPLDDSFEGTLARFSGMTKAQVSDTIALMEYYWFLEDYDAAVAYQFGDLEVEAPVEIEFNNENRLAVEAIEPRTILYFDLRNRQTIA